MQLFNFDHGFTAPQSFEIGPFTVVVEAAHCKNLERLPRRTLQRYGHDANFNRDVTRTALSQGEFLPTAELSLSQGQTMPPSTLFPGTPGTDAAYDLVMLLSFLTGRKVYFEHDLTWDPRRSYGERLLTGYELTLFAVKAWGLLPTVAKEGLSDALYCLVHAPQSPDLIGWGAYVSAAFDTIVTSWAKANGKTVFADADLINLARKTIEKSLIDQGVSPRSVSDIIARFHQIKTPSALDKIRSFVEANGLFPATPSDDQSHRLRRLNTLRNGISHSGTVRIDPELGATRSYSVAAAVVLLTQEIAVLYIARELLGVDTHATEVAETTVKRFFDEGTFRGQRVFEEEYEDYLARLESRWVEEGIVDPLEMHQTSPPDSGEDAPTS
ncbi:hypothetical protein [Lysobacter sp. HA18]